MKFSRSVNIERDIEKDLTYIVTANSRKISSTILNSFEQGIHSFTLIGSYGSGKSSFILEFINSIKKIIQQDTQNLIDKDLTEIIGKFTAVNYISITGSFCSTSKLLAEKLGLDDTSNMDEVLKSTSNFLKNNQENKQLSVICIDEFGKVLEYAAQNNPESEMYFLQQLSELCNDIDTDCLFVTTLHQGFEAYSKKLDSHQKQE